jgi:hypothetical protein
MGCGALWMSALAGDFSQLAASSQDWLQSSLCPFVQRIGKQDAHTLVDDSVPIRFPSPAAAQL